MAGMCILNGSLPQISEPDKGREGKNNGSKTKSMYVSKWLHSLSYVVSKS